MNKLILHWALNSVALLVVSHLVSGIYFQSFWTVIISALVFSLLNIFLRPFIILITLPINILSLGLFTFVINAFLFYLASKLVSGFAVGTFGDAFWGALLFSIVNFFLNLFLDPSKRVVVRSHRAPEQKHSRYRNVIDAEVVEKKDEHKGLKDHHDH